MSDADVRKWYKAAKYLRKKYSAAELVITGHQDWKGLESVDHTIILPERAQNSGR